MSTRNCVLITLAVAAAILLAAPEIGHELDYRLAPEFLGLVAFVIWLCSATSKGGRHD